MCVVQEMKRDEQSAKHTREGCTSTDTQGATANGKDSVVTVAAVAIRERGIERERETACVCSHICSCVCVCVCTLSGLLSPPPPLFLFPLPRLLIPVLAWVFHLARQNQERKGKRHAQPRGEAASSGKERSTRRPETDNALGKMGTKELCAFFVHPQRVYTYTCTQATPPPYPPALIEEARRDGNTLKR